MTILPVGTRHRGDPSRLGQGWEAIFKDGNADKILSPKVGGAKTRNIPRPVPDIYIYIILLNIINSIFFK